MEVGASITTNFVAKDEDEGTVLKAYTYSWDRRWQAPSTLTLGEPIQIRLVKKLNYEERRYSWMSIRSSDNGVAGDRTSLSGWTYVSIRVLDVNEPPIPTDARFSVSEDAKAGQSIGRPLKAKDPDEGQSDTLSFSIDRENCFSIKTGKRKRYVAFSPKYKNIMDHTITFKASARHSVHLLMYTVVGIP